MLQKRLTASIMLVASILLVGVACSEGPVTATCVLGPPDRIEARINRRIPHDPTSYTQGLLIHGGLLYESSGRYGESKLSTVDPGDGSVLDSVTLPDDVFAEGLALVDETELVQLTWKEGIAYRWQLEDFDSDAEPTGQFRYEGEGWGLTTLAGGQLLMSDGSDKLTERDSSTFERRETHTVRREGGPADMLNELEWDGASVWANRYQSNEILRIDPKCWNVTGVVDGSALRSEAAAEAARTGTRIDVLNGVAFDPSTGRFLVTGKWWPLMFEVDFHSG